MERKKSIMAITTTFIFALLMFLFSDSVFAASVNSMAVNKKSNHVIPGHALLWYENFEENNLPDGWYAEDLDGDGETWDIFDFSRIPHLEVNTHHGDKGLVSMACHPADSLSKELTDNIFRTQIFTVSAGDQIDFVLNLLDPDIADAEVYLWFIEQNSFDPVLLSKYQLTTAGFVECSIDLSELEGRTGSFAIEHVGYNQSSLCLDCMSYWKASGSFWKQVENGKWKYLYTGQGYVHDQWELINNVWYYFDSNEYMVTGWNFINGSWYYMNSSGAMLTGWQHINGSWYYMNSSGAMLTGWQFINYKWYYFYESSGAMAANRWIGGYYLNGNGVWIS